MLKGLIFAVLLAAVVAVPPGTVWNYCDAKHNYPLKITDIAIPNPVSGKSVTVTITGNTNNTIKSGTVFMNLKFDGMPFYSGQDNICTLITCPLAPGPSKLVITKVFPVAPPFKGTIVGNAYLTTSDYPTQPNPEFCVSLKVTAQP